MNPHLATWRHGHEAEPHKERHAQRAASHPGIAQAHIPGYPEFTGDKWAPPPDQRDPETNQK
ncbi:MAG TPA: hypothetical protein VGE76_01180 [Opitutaceae bacterium]